MAAQSVINLRPRKMIELFDQAIRLYRGNFLRFIGIIAIAEIPLQVISLGVRLLMVRDLPPAISSSQYLTTTATQSYLLTLFTSLLTLILVTGLATAALTSAITSSYLGEPVTIGGAYSRIRSSWGRLLGAMVLLGLLTVGIIIWTIIPCVGWLTGFGILIILSMVISPLIAPIVIIENRAGGNAIRRSWELVRRRFWWLVGFFLLLFVFNLLVIEGPVQIISTVLQSRIVSAVSASQRVSAYSLQAVATAVTSLLLSLLYVPLQSTCATLVYFDLRIRLEGFDLALMANQAGETPLGAVELAGQSSTAVAGPLVTWKEMGYFALFTVAGGALYFILVTVLAIGMSLLG